MNARFLLLPMLVFAACSGPRGCSSERSQSLSRTSSNGSTEPPLATAVSTPDPLTGRRAQVVARIATLTDSECDAIVLQFHLVPRDEVLDSLSEPRKDLLRYVRRIATSDELNDLERAINERKRPTAEELDARKRAMEDRRR